VICLPGSVGFAALVTVLVTVLGGPSVDPLMVGQAGCAVVVAQVPDQVLTAGGDREGSPEPLAQPRSRLDMAGSVVVTPRAQTGRVRPRQGPRSGPGRGRGRRSPLTSTIRPSDHGPQAPPRRHPRTCKQRFVRHMKTAPPNGFIEQMGPAIGSSSRGRRRHPAVRCHDRCRARRGSACHPHRH